MTTHIAEGVWLNTSDICSFDHLIEVSGLDRGDLSSLIEAGIIEPSNQDPGNYFFYTHCIVIARTARRLRDDFELDSHGLALALKLLDRIDQLETKLADAQARLGTGTHAKI
ncbi:chaperone modulator CbpM [Paralcaligenes ureilyticus]|uniref:Chaperone modulatory protein CbpM n=1 Tax=Paralcaligenes ureilyticus TaxID=627131 RepID=A0A4R3MBL8_9BURK|nr:chaperone modulator CbpM [Paralcaligenes ureilyticus]TCT10153.1 chaperone modulatory protein CbpM [Paralcaligenes ureilyticus]